MFFDEMEITFSFLVHISKKKKKKKKRRGDGGLEKHHQRQDISKWETEIFCSALPFPLGNVPPSPFKAVYV